MKMSRCTTYVKIEANKYLLFNARTKSVDAVDKEAFELIRRNPFLLDSSLIDHLSKSGHLTELSPEEEFNRMEALCTDLHIGFLAVKRHLIIPSYNCNLRCPYCWEKPLQKNEENRVGKKMSLSEADRLFTFIDKLDKGVDKKNPLIYFGGEPMLPENIELISYLMNLGTQRGYAHSFVTNGTNIASYLSVFAHHRIDAVQVTIDGPRRIHDSRRVDHRGEGTFDKIVGGIEMLRESNIKTYIRVNLDKKNIGYIPKLAAFIRERNWHKSPGIEPYIAPLFPITCGSYPHTFPEWDSMTDLLAIWNQPELLEIFGKGFGNLHPFEPALRNESWSPLFYNCNAHTNQLFYDPFGRIYTCWKAVGEREHSVGNFFPEMRFNSRYRDWIQRSVFKIKECGSCEYAFVCGGGCAFNAYTKKKTLFAPDCKANKKMLNEYLPFFYRNFCKNLPQEVFNE